MKNSFRITILLVLLCWFGNTAAQRVAPTETVVPIQWDRFTGRLRSDPLREQVRLILLHTNKYALNTWYNKVRKLSGQTGRYLDFGGIREHSIRPIASEVLALAVSLKLQAYDPDFTGVTHQEAVAKTVRMIVSLAARHRVNAGTTGWGYEWQSALWASFAATAGWMMWDELTPEEQGLVQRMTVSEADRLMDYPVPYYMNREGEVVSKGDSKAEENAWNSTIMMTATAMMPHHPHWERWYNKAIELQLSAYATPQDLHRTKKINGMRLNEILQGSNTDEYGIVINHGILHPDYIAAFMHNATNTWLYGLAGFKMPRASVHNGALLYHTMTEHRVGEGRTMYVRGKNGEATCAIYYPQGNDWGENRQACFLMMDVMALNFGWDRHSTVKASQWACAHAAEMTRMLARDTTGQYYQQHKEDIYPSREEWVAYHAAFCYLGLWMKDHRMNRLTYGQVR